MSERRGHNEGTIVERKDKNGDVTGYQAQISVAGGRRSHTATSKAAARKWMAQAKTDAARGRLAPHRPPTLAAYLQDSWLATVANKVKPRTQVSYTLNVQRVPEWLGSMRLDELKPAHFQRFYDELSKQGKAPRTVRQVHMTLHKALEDALRIEYLSRNPTQAVSLPRIPQNETSWYNNEQLVRLFDMTEGDRFHALWVTLGTLGLRLGEALGLRWSDIDWNRRTITITRTLQRNRLTGKLELHEPKTSHSRRTLRIPKQTDAALHAHRDRQDFDKQKAGDAWHDSGLVFCTGVGTPLDQGRIHYNWTGATKAAGLPRYRLHDLRHSFASNLIAGGMGLLEVAHLLGHTNGTMVTQVYGHVAPDDQGRAASLMDELLSRHAAVERP